MIVASHLEQVVVAMQVKMTLLSQRLRAITTADHSLGPAQAGQGLVEYSVIVALIVLAAIAAVTVFGQGITATFQKILGHVQGIPGL
jgi:Flp pilus assembly pilin Flp